MDLIPSLPLGFVFLLEDTTCYHYSPMSNTTMNFPLLFDPHIQKSNIFLPQDIILLIPRKEFIIHKTTKQVIRKYLNRLDRFAFPEDHHLGEAQISLKQNFCILHQLVICLYTGKMCILREPDS